MKMQSLVIAVLAALLVFCGDALAKGPGSGQGGGGGGGGDGEITTPDYGDLVILYRDASGVPILDEYSCLQRIAFPSDTCLMDCTDKDPCIIPVDPGTCAIQVGYESCTQEVDFGRMNNARAPDSVFASQLDDVIVNLSTADCITLDPAGRLVTSTVEQVENEDGDLVDTITSSEIDSPLQNLAIYKQLMMYGYLGDESNPIDLPAGILDTAARGLGAASDKTGKVNVDMVAYLNQIMGLTNPDTPTILDKICIEVVEEVMGNVQTVEKCFLDYSSHGYSRQTNFSTLPEPGFVSNREGGVGIQGWFEYLAPLDVTNPYYATFQIGRDRILHRVFGSDLGFEGGNIGGFAQAADDTRAVIDYMHTWPLPADYATPLVTLAYCPGSDDLNYDVSISSESGLQVPVQMVDGKIEGREFIVTVSNAGPDKASGTVTVDAEAAMGGEIFTVIVGTDPNTGDPTYTPGDYPPWEFAFEDLLPGASVSFPQLFSTSLGQKDTITWTATLEAEFDVLGTNNSVTATTNVRVTNSSKGRGGGEE